MSDKEWKKFYEENPPPKGLLEIKTMISNFCNYHVSMENNIVLITSGGTSVPLEHSTVRFVDNFSAGARGASSAEYFLREGYAVIYMHREKALEPFFRHIVPSELFDSSVPCKNDYGTNSIKVEGSVCDRLVPLLNEYKKIQEKRMLLKLQFNTLSSYLHMLYIAAQAIRPLGKDVILYLAAAVSDFYIPAKDMAEHKISSDEPLNLTLRVVPKMLTPLVHHWIPEAFIVSFKLETDSSLLLKKARGALEKYGHNLVIANELHKRKQEVVFVTKDEEKKIFLSNEELKSGKEIEEQIVKDLLCHYSKFKNQIGDRK
ncbi:Phosphopantothenate--cysteine ligase like protein [Argiope bruennichi]|uniref:Phosphopantothenate--cysteine ligase like protein n=1 Tax=Argiope bruennichi TaxID=94029 RepID=A0A8T0ELR4_ARGBR|nr:Phosphopantothenate--cysteine ligase like protein [Argiope bruennichi]